MKRVQLTKPEEFDNGETQETVTVSELIEKLREYPPDMAVFVNYEGCMEGVGNSINEMRVEADRFSEPILVIADCC